MLMRISKELWIEEGIKLKEIEHLKKHRRTRKKLYLVCTSYQEALLFEIIESRFLNTKYQSCYLVAVTKSKEKAVEQVRSLIDELYNLKTKHYKMLEAE